MKQVLWEYSQECSTATYDKDPEHHRKWVEECAETLLDVNNYERMGPWSALQQTFPDSRGGFYIKITVSCWIRREQKRLI